MISVSTFEKISPITKPSEESVNFQKIPSGHEIKPQAKKKQKKRVLKKVKAQPVKIAGGSTEGKNSNELEWEIKKNIIEFIASKNKGKKTTPKGKTGEKPKQKPKPKTANKPQRSKTLPVVKSADVKPKKAPPLHPPKAASAPIPAKQNRISQEIRKPSKTKQKPLPNFYPPEYFGMKKAKMPLFIRSSDRMKPRRFLAPDRTLDNMFKPIRPLAMIKPPLKKSNLYTISPTMPTDKHLNVMYSREREKKLEEIRKNRQTKIWNRSTSVPVKKTSKSQISNKLEIVNIMKQIKKLKNRMNAKIEEENALATPPMNKNRKTIKI